ncbi:phage tail tape measure C-terminal domain-containing protein [Granulicella paludicola]|uniref:phage tail tape measure C-terminal domain-containing protein n=1 Tax=Granulicella paludicola TaxID=474951 RepID=UPI0021DF55AF|nr:phage tail tape measure C-terminal domain-containing protein [Granulicella paludicola]
MAASITASLTAAIAKGEDFAFTISRMAEITGTSTEMFSKLAFAAKQSGVPLDTVRTSLERLSKTAYSAQNGQKEAIAAYDALGISVKDLQGPLKDSGSLLLAVSKSLDKFGEGTAKAGLEQKLLGRSGAELAPLLKQIATGFDTASEQATLFGVVIGDKTAAQAKRLHESMTALESVALGFSLRLLDGVSPALEDATNKILKFVTSGEGMATVGTIATDVSKAVYALGTGFQLLSQHTTAVKTALEGLALLQAVSIFIPLINSAAKAGTALDSIGLTGLKMVSRLSGLSAVLPILAAVSAELKLQAFMVAGLATEESWATAATYAWATSMNALKVALAGLAANPVTALVLGLTAVGVGFYRISSAAMATEPDAGKWADVWRAGILGVKEDANDLVMVIDLLTGRFTDLATRKWEFTPFQGLVQKAGQQRRGMSDNEYRMSHAGDIQQNALSSAAKPSAPTLPKEQNDKIDHLKLKMDELAASALAARQSLLHAGEGVDFSRADEIAKEFTKTTIELESQLKAQHKTLSNADKASILSSISDRINADSQAKYRTELVRSTESVLSQAGAQDILTRAVGRGADAVRTAAIAANAAKRDANQSEDWKKLNAGLRADNDKAFSRDFDATNRNADAQALSSVQAQIDTQLRLNSAVMQGQTAREEAAHAEEQANIRRKYADRGDNDAMGLLAELDANQRLFELKRQEANLSRAASMDPAAAYRDQVEALNDAADAATRAGQAINSMQMAAANRQAWQSYLDSIDKTTLAVGSAGQGMSLFFNQMSRDSESAAEKVHTVLEGAFNSLNSTLMKMVEGQKTSFADLFRGISADLMKLALQKTESAAAGNIMNMLGMGTQKPAAPVSSGSSESTALSGLAPIFSLIPGMSFLGAFGGHRATGGDVTAGMSYDVGEMGRETFVPTQSGKIIPNSQLARGGVYIGHIDATGSNDPAQTEAAVHRAMSHYGPAIAASTNHASREQKFRTPSSSRI